MDESEQIIATAKIVIPQNDGPVQATSAIEAIPNSALFDKFRKIESEFTPNVPMNIREDVEMSENASTHKRSLESHKEFTVPSAPPLQEVTNSQKLLNLPIRQHEFTSRTVILRNESCSHCLKK